MRISDWSSDVCSSDLLMRQRDKRAVFIVDAISLIDQTVQSFYDLGLSDIGVIQADNAMTDWSKPIQVASVQTLQRRGMPEVDLAIVDEAHVRKDRKGVVSGKRLSVRVDLGGRRVIKKK